MQSGLNWDLDGAQVEPGEEMGTGKVLDKENPGELEEQRDWGSLGTMFFLLFTLTVDKLFSFDPRKQKTAKHFIQRTYLLDFI